MSLINLDSYGPIISSKTVGEEVYELLKRKLGKNKTITIDLKNIKSMATFCAKQIFGRIYVEIGSQQFFERIILKNADDDLKTIIQIGIQHAIDEN